MPSRLVLFCGVGGVVASHAIRPNEARSGSIEWNRKLDDVSCRYTAAEAAANVRASVRYVALRSVCSSLLRSARSSSERASMAGRRNESANDIGLVLS